MRIFPRSVPGRIAALVAVVMVVIGVAVYTPLFGSSSTTIVAYFSRTTGLYTGDDVRVLGVHVGTVTSIDPQGTQVRVELDIEDGQKIPAGAKAAIVAPSLVSGRFVQVAPAYVSGPTMADGGLIPQTRTAVPIEFDEVKKQLTELAKALGPKGVGGPKGSLRTVIAVAEKNLSGGTAGNLRTSLAAMSRAADTLSSSRGDLFSTVRNLNSFIHNLVLNDAAIRRFSGQLTTLSGTLADNKAQLATAVDSLDQALGLVTTFVKSNTGKLGTTVKDLGELAYTVAQKNEALAGILQNAPFSAGDFYNTIQYQAVNGRASLNNLQGAAQLICGAVLGVGGTAETCKTAIGPLLDTLGLGKIPGAPGVPLPGASAAGSGSGSAKSATPKRGPDLLGTVTGLLGGTLGGGSGKTSNSGGGLLGILLPGGGK